MGEAEDAQAARAQGKPCFLYWIQILSYLSLACAIPLAILFTMSFIASCKVLSNDISQPMYLYYSTVVCFYGILGSSFMVMINIKFPLFFNNFPLFETSWIA